MLPGSQLDFTYLNKVQKFQLLLVMRHGLVIQKCKLLHVTTAGALSRGGRYKDETSAIRRGNDLLLLKSKQYNLGPVS